MSSVTIYTWVGFIVFLAVMFFLGFISSKKTKDISDFAIGGGNLGPYVLGLSFAATYLSAATFLGYPGWSHDWGFSNLWLFVAIIVGGPVGVMMIAKKARNLNNKQQSLSLPDWLGDFYNSDILRVGTGLILLFNVFYIAGQFVAGARIFEYLLGIPYQTGIILIASIVVLYVFAGGAVADIYTDAVQAVMMAIAGVFIFVSGIVMFWDGSIGSTFQGITHNLARQNENLVKVFNPESTHFYSFSAAAGAIMIQWAFASAPHLFNKVLGLKHEKDLGKMIATYIVASIFSLVILFGGIYSRAALGTTVADADVALIEYAVWAFPAVIVAILGVVILAAAMSTTDGIFVSISTVFANDIFLKVFVKRGMMDIEDRRAERIAFIISRITVPIIGLLACLLVVKPPAYIGDVMWIGISGVAAGTMGPILYSVYGKKKAPALAAELSMVIGLLSYLILYFGGIIPSTMSAGAVATFIGIVTMAGLAHTLQPNESVNEKAG
ncbi:sodium:solute symporter family protein [Virgibacillus alimentarius]|uniref:Sodium/proline symporter n=1 Tax=Virgibacillus alimentarius TaxID=698769 RepID=A0ABS4S8L2_9BACI|nr:MULTISPECIES: sodium:pantothenate symporter [Virgibacillus]MBP2257830.1 sodium/proline symporter [Virgibacillus alimentarius]HLR65551.1 sodium:pantothenate symporter [Virgibacillus sp.]